MSLLQIAFPDSTAATCPSCGTASANAEDILCPDCVAARRGLARVLPFDARRRRTEQWLAGRACGTCGAIAWTVTRRGDAFCAPCAATTPTRTNSVPAGGAR